MTVEHLGIPEMDAWETRVARIAQTTHYPHTPDLAATWQPNHTSRRVRIIPHRRLAWAALAIVTVLALSLTVTPIRAAIGNWLQMGVVWIQLGETEETIDLAADLAASANSADFTDMLEQMPPPMSLAAAARQVSYTFNVPTLLPEADAVYHSRIMEMDLITLVWGSPSDNAHALLQILGPGGWAHKMFPQAIAETTVKGAPAYWTTGPYLVLYPNGDMTDRHLVRNHALIWQEDEITYRFESALSMEDAVRVAESLAPVTFTEFE